MIHAHVHKAFDARFVERGVLEGPDVNCGCACVEDAFAIGQNSAHVADALVVHATRMTRLLAAWQANSVCGQFAPRRRPRGPSQRRSRVRARWARAACACDVVGSQGWRARCNTRAGVQVRAVGTEVAGCIQGHAVLGSGGSVDGALGAVGRADEDTGAAAAAETIGGWGWRTHLHAARAGRGDLVMEE